MSLELKKFDMNMITDDKVVVLIGKRETGKSFLVKDLLFHHKDIPVGSVISGTEGANSFYSKIMPSIFIHGEYNENIISNVLKRQKKVINAINKECNDFGSTNIDPRVFIILDDCLYDKSWINSKYVRSLFMNGRHYKIMFIITMQYSLGIPPNLRTNIDFTFILRENIVSNRKRLYEQYAGMFPSFDSFCQVMDQCTENFECLVINNNAKSNKLEDQVFWYKANSHDDFKLGAPQFWQYHSENFNTDSEDDEFNINEVTKKNKPIINVKKTY
jgi:hypothetical protein